MSKQDLPTISKRPIAKLGSVVASVALAAGMALPMYALAAEGAGPANNGGASMEQPPDKPSGDNGEEPPGGFGGGGEGGAPGGAPGGMGGGMGGPNTQSFDYSGTYTGTKTADGTSAASSNETFEATDALTNVALAQNAGTLDLVNDTLVKAGDAN